MILNPEQIPLFKQKARRYMGRMRVSYSHQTEKINIAKLLPAEIKFDSSFSDSVNSRGDLFVILITTIHLSIRALQETSDRVNITEISEIYLFFQEEENDIPTLYTGANTIGPLPHYSSMSRSAGSLDLAISTVGHMMMTAAITGQDWRMLQRRGFRDI